MWPQLAATLQPRRSQSRCISECPHSADLQPAPCCCASLICGALNSQAEELASPCCQTKTSPVPQHGSFAAPHWSSRAMPHPDRQVPLQFDKFGRISSIWLARRVRTVSDSHLLCASACPQLLAGLCCLPHCTSLCCALAPQSRAELFAPPSASPLAMVRTRC